MDSTKYDTLIHKTIAIDAKSLNANLDDSILQIAKNKFGNHWLIDGYVLADTIKIIRRSTPRRFPNRLNATMAVDVIFSTTVMNPVKGNAITGKISGINKAGFLIEIRPFLITVLIEQHENKALFKDLKVGDEVKVIVVATKYNQRNNTVIVNAKMEEEFNRKMKIKIVKGKKQSGGGDDVDVLEKAYTEEIGEQSEEPTEDVVDDEVMENNSETADDLPTADEEVVDETEINNETGQEEFDSEHDDDDQQDIEEELIDEDEEEDDEEEEEIGEEVS